MEEKCGFGAEKEGNDAGKGVKKTMKTGIIKTGKRMDNNEISINLGRRKIEN